MNDGEMEAPRFGPAMLALDDRRRAFVQALLAQDKPNYGAAARAAGYSDPGPKSSYLRKQGHELAHDARVIAALHEEAGKRFRLLGWLGVKGLAEIAADKRHPDNFKANKELADRFGFAAVQKHEVLHEEKRVTPTQKLQEIKELCEFLGVPFEPGKFMGTNAVPMIEGEVVENG